MLVRECSQNIVKWPGRVRRDFQERFRFLNSRLRHVPRVPFGPRFDLFGILLWCQTESKETQHQKRKEGGPKTHGAYYAATRDLRTDDLSQVPDYERPCGFSPHEPGVIPILSFVASLNRCLQPRYRLSAAAHFVYVQKLSGTMVLLYRSSVRANVEDDGIAGKGLL
jgi:hypothetical protein